MNTARLEERFSGIVELEKLESNAKKVQEMEEHLVSIADRAQRGIDAAVTEMTERIAASQQRESSDWSDWSLVDSEEFQELAKRVEALETDWAEWAGSPGAPAQYQLCQTFA